MNDVSRRNFLRAAAGTAAGIVGAGLAAPAVRAAAQLSNEEIIRAWKDEAFRSGLTPQQLAQLPKHPAGMIEVDCLDLDQTNLQRPNTVNRRSRHPRCCSR